MYFSAIGQDSHRFEPENTVKPLVLAGVTVPGPGLQGNSDADVVLHALCNAISGLSTVNVLGAITDKMCSGEGITDSSEYVKVALATLGEVRLIHLSITIEAKRPYLSGYIDAMRKSLSQLTGVAMEHVGITATTGEGLTAFGRGEGIQAFVIASAFRSV